MPWRGILPPKGRHWRSSPDELEALDRAGLIEWSKNGIPRKKIFGDERTTKSVQDIWSFMTRRIRSTQLKKIVRC
jgi:adenine-specific DNA-methyltransferase